MDFGENKNFKKIDSGISQKPHFGFGGIPRFRDFEDSEISRNLKFLAVPVLCHDNVMQPRKGSGARRAAVCLECVSARPAVAAMPHDRSGASLGKVKICDFEILVPCSSIPKGGRRRNPESLGIPRF